MRAKSAKLRDLCGDALNGLACWARYEEIADVPRTPECASRVQCGLRGMPRSCQPGLYDQQAEGCSGIRSQGWTRAK